MPAASSTPVGAHRPERRTDGRDRHPPRHPVGVRDVRDRDGRRGRVGDGGASVAVGVAAGCGGRRSAGCPVADEADDVGEGGVVAELELVVAFDAEAFADEGEHLGLLDGVDAEVGFEVEVEVQHVGGVAGLVGHHRQHLGLHIQVRRRRRRLGSATAGSGSARPSVGCGAAARARAPAAAPEPGARSRTKPMTWARVG